MGSVLVGVMSDSHDNIANIVRAARVFKEAGVELVIHLGDIVAPFSLARLASELGGVRIEAVYGNNCGEKILLYKTAQAVGAEIADPPRTVRAAGRRLLLLHGTGSPESTVEVAEALAASGKWDAVLYGHTHQVDYRYIQGRLLLNPGETAGVMGKPTVAILDTETLLVRIVGLA